VSLTKSQARYLRGLGQRLRAQVHIGHAGLTDGILGTLEDHYRGKELVKLRLLPSCAEEPKAVAAAVAERSGSELVGVVGRTFVLYRPNPELKDRIELP
jgi:RNA-binding protein